jgi:hypothetical protein
MSGELGKTRDREKLDDEDEDFNDRAKGKLSDEESFEEDKLDTPKRRLKTGDEEEYDEGEGSYLSPEDDNFRSGRSRTGRTEEIPSATVRSHEAEGLLPPPSGTEGNKYIPYEFKPITSEADPKDFSTKTKTRFSLGTRIFSAC